ncbi:hypothetical protein C8R45DRAFT_937575 [Mycena sanguinolenta]|nr:hypothetical protein C8R45DRAFT_937575 [Mycena sanguinolenta]
MVCILGGYNEFGGLNMCSLQLLLSWLSWYFFSHSHLAIWPALVRSPGGALFLQSFGTGLRLNKSVLEPDYALRQQLINQTSYGLSEESLYDVPNPGIATGNISVPATGINISCGYVVPQGNLTYAYPGEESSDSWGWKVNDTFGWSLFEIPLTQPGIISAGGSFQNTVFFYSTNPITDSNGNTNGTWAGVSPSMNLGYTNISTLQLFRCSQSLVRQTAVVDAQTMHLFSIEPDIQKTASTWMPYTGPSSPAGFINASSSLTDSDFVPLNRLISLSSGDCGTPFPPPNSPIVKTQVE